jgi:hypothetical protein
LLKKERQKEIYNFSILGMLSYTEKSKLFLLIYPPKNDIFKVALYKF